MSIFTVPVALAATVALSIYSLYSTFYKLTEPNSSFPSLDFAPAPVSPIIPHEESVLFLPTIFFPKHSPSSSPVPVTDSTPLSFPATSSIFYTDTSPSDSSMVPSEETSTVTELSTFSDPTSISSSPYSSPDPTDSTPVLTTFNESEPVDSTTQVLPIVSNVTDYCHIPSCNGERHVLCEPKSKSECGDCFKVGLTETEKQDILSLHNELRQKVAGGKEKRGDPGPQPAAVPGTMLNMSWNEELADIARNYVKSCPLHYESNACLDTPQMKVNVNVKSSEGENPLEIVRRWYDEVQDSRKEFIQHYRYRQNITEYINMARADSTLLGCGYLNCEKNITKNVLSDDKEHMTVKRSYLVCIYGPGENVEGKSVYPTI